MTAEAFYDRYAHAGERVELVAGEVVPMSPTGDAHTECAFSIGFELGLWL
jgi:Uma2 family endonuclease